MEYKILIVDDDPDVLAGYKRNLRKEFNIDCAESGPEALEMLKAERNYALILSDYNMPKMNGIEFLKEARNINSDASRIMITGYADLETAIESVNEGHVFRFLTKPISPDSLIKALNDGIKQYKLQVAERELLGKTLRGSIRILIDILSILQPDIYDQSAYVRQLSKKIADRMKLDNIWEVEIASMLSKIGCLTISSEVVNKKARGKLLTKAEEELYNSHPEIGASLLQRIPRLENIADSIKKQMHYYGHHPGGQGQPKGVQLPLISRILKVASDFDDLLRMRKSGLGAFRNMEKRAVEYDPEILEVLKDIIVSSDEMNIRMVMFKELRIGMVLAEDIKDTSGNKLVSKNIEISDFLMTRLIQAKKVRNIVEPIRVLDSSKNSREEF